MQTAAPAALRDERIHLPEFEQLVRELDDIIREDFRRELEPAIEDLVLARFGRLERAA